MFARNSEETTASRDLNFVKHWVNIYPRLRTYVIALLQDVNDAEDILQEVSLEAIKSYSSFDPSRCFQKWLFGIARNRVRRYYRSKKQNSNLIFDTDTMLLLEAGVEHSQDQLEAQRQALRTCIRRLSQHSRYLLSLRYTQNRSAESIAADYSCNANTVYQRLTRIRAKLRACAHRYFEQQGA
ncbi:sigma-70 family RNA polymerase sigma factor [Aeoliella mucimassa]|uniref:RNA polymerase sigma factor CnrH n=1 Tax=Aeoliella mucimassa TaxID=2527972 RepID=A0A518APQ6_9BACT|nr:sigma-70 family RNA polymerase sigma factor [Aeoliella mucimassa]QDU56710.1 RNA polymerase sigma factor CnrH [Aeoliella mucimassa]